jgi:pilus assembly protein CpaD
MKLVDPVFGSRRRRRTVVRAAAVLVPALMLAGCYAGRDLDRDTTASIPRDYRQRHPIVLQEKDRTLDIFVGANRGGLSPSQRADVLAYAHVWKREATGGVVIDMPAGTPNERAAAESLREIQSILVAVGFPLNGIAVRSYAPSDPGKLATIKLKYPRIAADAGPCGRWPNDLGPSFNPVYLENRPYWNLGCAMQRNLAAMVENPSDLVQPRGETPAYTARRTVVLDKYRKGESTATIATDANAAKISDIGK